MPRDGASAIYGDCIEIGGFCLSALRSDENHRVAQDSALGSSWFVSVIGFWAHFDHFTISDRALLQAPLACSRYSLRSVIRCVQFIASSTLVQSFWGDLITHPQPPPLTFRTKAVKWHRGLSSRRRWFIGRRCLG